jgi:hypothetical protein
MTAAGSARLISGPRLFLMVGWLIAVILGCPGRPGKRLRRWVARTRRAMTILLAAAVV